MPSEIEILRGGTNYILFRDYFITRGKSVGMTPHPGASYGEATRTLRAMAEKGLVAVAPAALA